MGKAVSEDERPTSNEEKMNIELGKDEHRTSNVQHRMVNCGKESMEQGARSMGLG